MIIIGIDPGIHGSYAMIYDGALLSPVDLPLRERKHGGGHEIDADALAGEMHSWSGTTAYIERINARPPTADRRSGTKSMMTFGHCAGVIEGVLAACGVNRVYVNPMTWKGHMKMIGMSKKESVGVAQKLWPSKAHEFVGPRGGLLDGRADAALIAQYGWEREHAA